MKTIFKSASNIFLKVELKTGNEPYLHDEE